MEYQINIHGIIGGYPQSKNDKNKYFSYNDFLVDLNNIKKGEFDLITLDIDSVGGYVDVAEMIIKDLQGLDITIAAKNSGDVCSAASKLFTLAQPELRVFYPSFGVFLIHNPWSFAEGDAQAHLEAAIQLKETELEYAQWYADKTGAELEVIQGLMKENQALTPKQVGDLGFATVAVPQVQAFCKLVQDEDGNCHCELESEDDIINNKKTIKNEVDMNDNEELKEKVGLVQTSIDAVKALFNNDKPEVVALLVNTADGVELNFPDITDIAEIAEGVKTDAEDGEHILPDGLTTVTVEGGSVTKVEVKEEVIEEEVTEEETPAEEAEVVEDEVAELKKTIEDLKAELEALKAKEEVATLKLEEESTSKKEIEVEIEAMKEEVAKIKTLASNHQPTVETPEADTDEQSFSFKRRK